MIIYFYTIVSKVFNQAIPGDVFDKIMNRKEYPEGCLNFSVWISISKKKSISKSWLMLKKNKYKGKS